LPGNGESDTVYSMSSVYAPDACFGADFWRLRKALGLSQRTVAELVGCHPSLISHWENGRCAVPLEAYQQLQGLRRKPADSHSFTFIDLFAGIGGFRRGFEAVGGHCVFTSERDRFARATYTANFGEHALGEDITGIDAMDIPEHDVLLAGFPCQPFSLAGVSKKNSLGRKHGFECETQGTLFFDIERILRERRPTAFVLENVKNLKSHDRGRTFDVIRRTLEEKLGYRIAAKVIDARVFVPQHRERIFIVGLHPDLDARFDFSEVALPAREAGPKLEVILHREDGTEAPEERFLDEEGRVRDRYTLSPGLWTYLKAYAEKHRRAGNGFGYGLVGPDDVARTLSARYYKDGSEILIRQDGHRPRRLTPRECARLMGFDRPGEKPIDIPVSDVQAYRQFGNAVAVPVVEAIAVALMPYLKGHRKGCGDPDISIQETLGLI
jgi:DNA (cytosine-5)-methyltransferase 1